MMLPLLKDLLAIAGCSFFIVALTGLFLRTTRRIATSIAVFLAAPLAVAFAIDACGSHATRLLIARGAPLTALAVSADEGLLALADQKGEIVVLRTDSGRILRAIKKGQVRALYFGSSTFQMDLRISGSGAARR
jgi:hypothetical protein